MKIAIIILVALAVGGFWALNRVEANSGLQFRCSVCGSPYHGSLWHDSDKDGVPDR